MIMDLLLKVNIKMVLKFKEKWYIAKRIANIKGASLDKSFLDMEN